MNRLNWYRILAMICFTLAGLLALTIGLGEVGAAPGIGYPNIMIYDTWRDRTGATQSIQDNGGNQQFSFPIAPFGANTASIVFGSSTQPYVGRSALGGLQLDATTGQSVFIQLNEVTGMQVSNNGTPPAVVIGTAYAASFQKQSAATNDVMELVDVGGTTGSVSIFTGSTTLSQRNWAEFGTNTNHAGICNNTDCTILLGKTTSTVALNAGGNLTEFPWSITLAALNAYTNTTVNVSTTIVPTAANGSTILTPKQCVFTIATAGLTGGTCTYTLQDTSSATALCTVSQSCTTAVQTATSCVGSSTAAAGDTLTLKIVAPAGDTSGTGTMVCTGFY